MQKTGNEPSISPPLQAPPVYRDPLTTPDPQDTEGGVEAAGSGCGHLTGAARQMCFMRQHGYKV